MKTFKLLIRKFCLSVKYATVLSKEVKNGWYIYKIHASEDAPENYYVLTTLKNYNVGQLISTDSIR